MVSDKMSQSVLSLSWAVCGIESLTLYHIIKFHQISNILAFGIALNVKHEFKTGMISFKAWDNCAAFL